MTRRDGKINKRLMDGSRASNERVVRRVSVRFEKRPGSMVRDTDSKLHQATVSSLPPSIYVPLYLSFGGAVLQKIPRSLGERE